MTKYFVKKDELIKYLAQILNITQYKDYCPNGLQVEGRQEIKLIVTGVTASLALIEAAVDLKADAILVHHGYFWRGENQCIIGLKQRRLKMLLSNDINLFAYHLPLDDHNQLGNNAQLANQLCLCGQYRFGDNNLGWIGIVDPKINIKTVGELAKFIEHRLERIPFVIGDIKKKINKVAWCSGAAQNFLSAAAVAGATVFISGEISESTVHIAREMDIIYIVAGHHATERYGVKALGLNIENKFGIYHKFIDINNPI